MVNVVYIAKVFRGGIAYTRVNLLVTIHHCQVLFCILTKTKIHLLVLIDVA